MIRILLACLSLLLCSSPALAVEPMRYIHPPAENANDHRSDYYWDLLKFALEATVKTYGPYELSASPLVMNSKRAEETLSSGKDLTLILATGTQERETIFTPVRIPLDKGLSGYRLFLINADNQSKFEKVSTIDDLQPFTMGQGATWIDQKILTNAGMTVVVGSNYEGLFSMLRLGRFDLFPRGLNEISAELSTGIVSMPKLTIEKNLLLYYPLPRYYMFARDPRGAALAKRVDDGLRLLIKSGEFDRLYLAFKKRMLTGINLSGRRLFRTSNPFLTPETPFNQPDLWDTLEKEIKG